MLEAGAARGEAGRGKGPSGVYTWLAAGVMLAAVGAGGCKSDESSSLTGPSSCYVDVPCKDDPSQTCKEPCKSGAGSGAGNNTTSTGPGGSGGSGGSGGFAGSVDVTGQVVQFTDTAFDEVVVYTGKINVVAPGVDTQTVEALTVNGKFTLEGAAAGDQWVLAEDADGGTGGAFSTFSLQRLDGAALAVPVVTVGEIEDVGSQIDALPVVTGRAHVVMQITDETGEPIEGVEVLGLAGSSVGYDLGVGQYTNATGVTGLDGMAVVMNATVAGPGSVVMSLFLSDGTPIEVEVPVAPDAVTWAPIGIDLTP